MGEDEVSWEVEQMRRLVIFAVASLAVCACDSARLNQLEHENQQLKESLKRASLDVQAKCSADTKHFIESQYPPTPDRIFIDFNNHYNASLNKCFVEVETHLQYGDPMTYFGVIELFDVYENQRQARLDSAHGLDKTVRPVKLVDTVSGCWVQQQKCDSIERFRSLVLPFMSQ
jgi:hypothetical protein